MNNQLNITFEYPEFIKPALFNNVQYSIIKAGRRTGKTYNTAQWLIESLLNNGNSSGLWVDTTQANLIRYIERYFSKILKSIWSLCTFDKTKLILYLPNKSYIDFRSATRPESLEGFDYDYIVLNEAGIILRNHNLWYNSIYPMSAKAIVKVIGTPKGKNLFHKLFYKSHYTYKSYSYNCYDSPYWKDNLLQDIQATVPDIIWRQEYLAEFVAEANNVFCNYTRCILPESELNDIANIQAGGQYVMGIDLAKYRDYTVIYIADSTNNIIVKQYRWNNLDWVTQKNKIIDIWTKYNCPTAIIDSTGVGDPIFDDLISYGNMHNLVSYKFHKSSKLQLIQSLILAIENEYIKFPKYPELINELEVFEYKLTATGHYQYSAPSGMHDDCVIALALTWHGLNMLNTSNVYSPQIRGCI